MPHFNHARVISTQALKTRRRIAMDYEALLKLTDQIVDERSGQNGQRVSRQEDECKSQEEHLKIKPPLMSYEELLKLTDQIIEEKRGLNGQRVSHQEDECKSQEEDLKIKPPLMSYEELLKLTDQIIEEKSGLNGQRVSHKPPYDHEAERKSQRPVLKFKQTPMDYEALLDLAKRNQELIKTSAQVKKQKPLLAITQKRKLEAHRCIKEWNGSTTKHLRIEDDDSNMDDFLKDEKRHKALTKKRRL